MNKCLFSFIIIIFIFYLSYIINLDVSMSKNNFLEKIKFLKINFEEKIFIFYLCEKISTCSLLKGNDIIFTYNDKKNVLNYENTTWTEIRNLMYLFSNEIKTLKNKSKNKNTPNFYCFSDGDVLFGFNYNELKAELIREKEFSRIISLNLGGSFKQKYRVHADAIFNCFNDENINLYLPYETKYDNLSWWMSQLNLNWKANIIQPFVYKIYNNLLINNEKHNDYPRGTYYEILMKEYTNYINCTPPLHQKGNFKCLTIKNEIIYNTEEYSLNEFENIN